MKKLIIIFLFILGCSVLIRTAIACDSVDAAFTLNIGNLNINIDKLEKLCTKENCAISKDYITIKSHYDQRVAVIIGKTSSISGFKGIIIRLPYALKENYYPIATVIKPEEYKWKESVKKDLIFLREIDSLNMTDSEIDTISNLATNHMNILHCKDKWESVGSNCDCKGCYKCGGGPPIETFLPNILLTK